MTTTRKPLALRITRARKAKGLSMYAAAKGANMPPHSWLGYEQGKMPGLAQAAKIADVLDVSLDWLAGRETT